MYHTETDTPAVARTSNLNEELGQVSNIKNNNTQIYIAPHNCVWLGGVVVGCRTCDQ